jgi:hypothetical protein
VSRSSAPSVCSKVGTRTAYRPHAPAASPASPIHRAWLARAANAPRCSLPSTRTRTGTRPAHKSRAPTGSPVSPIHRARHTRAARGGQLGDAGGGAQIR